MYKFSVYKDGQPIQVIVQDESCCLNQISKVCVVKNRVFLLNSSLDLFYGDLDLNILPVYRIRANALDVDCDGDLIYVVDESGFVFHTKAMLPALENAENNWKEMAIINSKTCPHGLKNVSEKVRVCQVNCNNDGVLFTTVNKELYGIGDFAEILSSECQPIQIECFRGLKIVQVATGDNFVVVLTQKKLSLEHATSANSGGNLHEDNMSLASDSSDVFINSECPKCVPEVDHQHLNPLRNHFTHQEHLPYQNIQNVSKSTTETTSMASSPCPSDNTFEEELELQHGENGLITNVKKSKDSTPLKVNTDAALNFFLDLSVSGEEYIGQTKLLTENVTKNLTSMVYEGVKTLSRHMSGSDNNEGSLEVPDETLDNCASNSKMISHPLEKEDEGASECSSSFLDLGSTIDLHSECATENKIAKLNRIGNNLLATDVWCFGSVNKGHLGTGDHLKRTRMNNVLGLSNQGVVRVSCGKEHSTALTLDGRLYLWGNNNKNQISVEKVDDFSVPRRFRATENVQDTACGSNQTVIMLNDLKILIQNRENENSVLNSDVILNGISETWNQCNVAPVLASGSLVIRNHFSFCPVTAKHLTSEQHFLEDALLNQGLVIRPLLKKLSTTRFSHALDQLCQQYQILVNVSALNIKSLIEFYYRRITCPDIVILNNCNELIALYRLYARKFCDVLCVRGFKIMEQLITTNSSREPLKTIFHKPFKRIWAYIDLFYDLLQMEKEKEINKGFLEERKGLWEKFSNEKDLTIEEAERTLRFWDLCNKTIVQKLQTPERRVILDSKQVPLKLNQSMFLKSSFLVLFSDLLCNIHANNLVIFPLKTIWISSMADSENRKHAIKITTPIETLVLAAQTHEDKMQWIEGIEKCIRHSLSRPMASKVPQYRNASFTYPDKHNRYGGVKYFGRWYLGNMHGIGHLEFSDGRVYNGQMNNNEISGFGRMFTPGFGIYEGDFERGKFHGYGVLELQNKTTYEGNFKEGLYCGHGTLINDFCTYVGDFQNNSKSGYGILDDNLTGEKYMGMFQENKRHGYGICITMKGDYFEGNFVNDQLCGEGVANFESSSNNVYYEGEMTISGPNGKGTMFVGRNEIKSHEITIVDDRDLLMDGSMLTGSNLSGTWSDVKVVNGSLILNRQFPKYSKLFGKLAVDNDRKWSGLFNDWQQQLFGMNILNTDHSSLDHKVIWSKIAIFINTTKSKEKLKSDDFMTKHFNSIFESLSRKTSNEKLSESTHFLDDNISVRSQQIQGNSFNFSNNLKASASQLSLDEKLTNQSPGQLMDLNLFSKKLDVLVTNQISNKLIPKGNEIISSSMQKTPKLLHPHLEFVPNFGIRRCETNEEFNLIRLYLHDAFKNVNHPLGVLSNKISHCFYSSYGCWKIKPTTILYSHAMKEWESITKRVYLIVLKMFPGLPLESELIDGEYASFRFILYPILLSEGIYSLLFVLYASKCSQKDELYRHRLISCELKTDQELATFLRIDL